MQKKKERAMKGKIISGGYLKILRGKKYKGQECPFDNIQDATTMPCGDWCPLFGEPEENTSLLITKDGSRVEHNGYILGLCHKELRFEELKDER
jgi:hypothetical protein